MTAARRRPAAGHDATAPVAALRRIAYLLERDGAVSYKVRAFRRAADSVEAVEPQRLAQLAAVGRLDDLPDVGKTTAQAIAEALAGQEPSYLRELEGRPPPELSPAAAAVRRALLGDFHSHSDWSDGGSPVEQMAQAAHEAGHRYWALTDHSPRLTVAHGLDAERLTRQLALVKELNRGLAPFRILSGIEVDILEDGSLDQDESLLAELDLVVASVHSKLGMERAAMTERMLAAIESPHTDVLGHCTGRIITGRGRPPSAFDAPAVFAACAQSGTAVEINSRPDRRDPPLELLGQAIDAGCLFSIDSDAHAPGQLEWLAFGCEQAVESAVPLERVVNTWPLEVVLDWTAGHAR